MELEFLTLGGIVGGMLRQFLPVYAAMALVMGASFVWRGRLGLYGRIYESPIGMIGFALVLFWLLTALMANWVALFDPFGPITRASRRRKP